MNLKNKLYPFLLLMLILASFFHVQAAIFAIPLLIIAMPMEHKLMVLKTAGRFAILWVPAMLGLIVGYKNNTYLILKDLYYFSIPILFITTGVVLAYRLSIESFLKTLVYAGVLTSILVTAVSVSYMGFSALFDPYSAHYAIGIVGTPVPPIALACLLFSKKFNVKLFSRFRFTVFVAANAFGVYMFASRTYTVMMAFFVLLLVVDKIKRIWIMPTIFMLVMLFTLLPTDLFKTKTSETFMGKMLGSFNELKMGDYNTEQDINIKYRGYESFMAVKSYAEGGAANWIFGGLGKLIDLKTFVRLGEDTDFQFIPVLHNGWLYILVKTGIMGVLTYILTFFGLITSTWKRYADARERPAIRLFGALIIGCVMSLMFTNYIVTSFFNTEMSIIMITLGYSYVNFKSLVNRLQQREQAAIQKYKQATALKFEQAY
ncbi:hypothetical protein [Mucilaginibacter aquaedulcis]|uniref:hypothetical protein n=1 Tax=Mucilaginibacter aquaedulcis TaxID=1187081 RepID=UPI0025B4825D|nr:hypothetical protein [Mucilaginibacter aquaedulcis]MDN3548556.1 hypothetical protein [Mucilaginibacter aquaedulcis]